MDIYKRGKSNPITSKQKEILVEFISARKDMYTGRFTASYTKEHMQTNWMELTNILNSVPHGPAKDWKHWRKTWVDLKKNTKAKFVEQKKHYAATGGGPPLPPMDDKLLNIISPVAIDGNININESEVIFDFENGGDAEIVLDANYEEEPHSETPSLSLQKDATDTVVFHDYCIPCTSKENIGTPKLKESINIKTPLKKRRTTKTIRLQESLKNNEKFLQISQENINSEKQFREKKLEIMLSDSQNKQTYYEKKLHILQVTANAAAQIANAINQIATEVKEIKNTILLKK